MRDREPAVKVRTVRCDEKQVKPELDGCGDVMMRPSKMLSDGCLVPCMRLKGFVNRHPVNFLLDCGSTENHFSERLATLAKVQLRRCDKPYMAETATGAQVEVSMKGRPRDALGEWSRCFVFKVAPVSVIPSLAWHS